MENQPQNLPNSVGVLVLGILSIVFCFCYGVIGITLGIIAIVLANKANKLYLSSPDLYSESSYKNMRAGRICAIVGLSLSSLYIVLIIIYIAIVGAFVGTNLLDVLNQYQ